MSYVLNMLSLRSVNPCSYRLTRCQGSKCKSVILTGRICSFSLRTNRRNQTDVALCMLSVLSPERHVYFYPSGPMLWQLVPC